MSVIHLYRVPGISNRLHDDKYANLKQLLPDIVDLKTEICYNIEISNILSQTEFEKLRWLLSHPLAPQKLKETPHYNCHVSNGLLIEIGPRLNFSTPFSTNALSMCCSMGLTKITRLEVSVRYLISVKNGSKSLDARWKNKLAGVLHDKMTECIYESPITSFDHGIVPEKWFVVNVMKDGRKALEQINKKLGLAFDDWDLNYYTDIFQNILKRNPTSVECFDLAQSNSEHSRHWFFKGKMIVDNQVQEQSLIDMIIATQNFSNPNNVIKFSDNSSAILGYDVEKMKPRRVEEPSKFVTSKSLTHIIFTAETHNFPTGVAPFSGATTGTGGRIRDVQAVGRGGFTIAGTAGYSVGNLLIPGYDLPWENKGYEYPDNLALPVDILIEASNGASDYGNKFGEPVVSGFTRSFGSDVGHERIEWIKPIMFSGGIGSMEGDMIEKYEPRPNMKVTKIGGPVYRIGVGGGSASSVQVQGDNESKLDFNAVQRGDAEMENKLNRVIRSCIEHQDGNPICSIHDQGAGGNGNVLKELVEPAGAVIFTNRFSLGDETINTMELWGAEYQESNAILVQEKDSDKLMKISKRERCQVDFVGVVTGNGKVILSEEKNPNQDEYLKGTNSNMINHPFNLDLELVLGKMPRKEFILDEVKRDIGDFKVPRISVEEALGRVLRSVSVCSKRFLTNKVDRCVTGLIAQQQCVGPLHTPLADYCVTALTMLDTKGVASSIGEQPIKGLVDPAAGARMTVAEALTNLMFVKISDLKDVKCSGNWMWAAKLPGEGRLLYTACQAMCGLMSQLGIAIDGGKDSLSMAARVGKDSVKAPGTLVVSTYAPCPDIRCKVTPDLKMPCQKRVGALLWIKLSRHERLGGSIFAQCYSSLGRDVPDVEDPSKLSRGFQLTQRLIKDGLILSGHDISDGGMITCLLEMSFAGLSGLQIKIETDDALRTLFHEEVGWLIEVDPSSAEKIIEMYAAEKLVCTFIGQAVGYGMSSSITIRNGNNQVILDSTLSKLFKTWEETSYKLECRQANLDCVTQEYDGLHSREGPKYNLTFDPELPPANLYKVRVAVIREEGTNGDREMATSLYMAGFEVWDVTMQDLLDEKVTTAAFKGLIFPGGFSYADVLGSAKGWAGCLLFNDKLKKQFQHFVDREETFSFGVCNGCQLMALLGWIGTGDSATAKPDIVLDHNSSERFECRFGTVKIMKSPSIMTKGMEGSVLGVWLAHGEGRFTYRTPQVYESLKSAGCLAMAYVDDRCLPTEVYPMNPNGSKDGVTAICSENGRHLAMMPHPERCTLMWQWPYVPTNFSDVKTSPWLKLFRNAYEWAVKQ